MRDARDRDRNRRLFSIALFTGLMAMATGCSDDAGPVSTSGVTTLASLSTAPAVSSPPALDDVLVTSGADLYVRFCAECHGDDLAGAAEWRVPNPDGSYPPPPQDSSGHTWHHGDELLVDLILKGSDFPQSRMPAFGDRLAESEVMAVLEFLKSSWGEEERAIQWDVTLRERGSGS